MPEPSHIRDATVVARLSSDAATVQKIAEALAGSPLAEEIAVAAFEDASGRWSLAVHFRRRPDETSVRALIASAAGIAAAQALTFETLAPTDWVDKSREGLAPVAAGRFVVHSAHARQSARINGIAIEIDASLAFGTGHHGSTRGCLLALDRIMKSCRRAVLPLAPSPLAGEGARVCPRSRMGEGLARRTPHPFIGSQRRVALSRKGRGRNNKHRGCSANFFTSSCAGASGRLHRKSGRRTVALDVGTGTGVLAIAAAKALRRGVLASDVDRRAVAIARDNARINRVGGAVEVIHAAGLRAAAFRGRGPYRLIFANILLAPLKGLATPIARLVAPNGRLVLSGLLTADADAALASYRARGLALVRRIRLEGWATLVLTRPAARRSARHGPRTG